MPSPEASQISSPNPGGPAPSAGAPPAGASPAGTPSAGTPSLGAPAASAPILTADILLQAALRAGADLLWIEPVQGAHAYAASIERGGQVIATARLDASLGAVVIARLAYIANVDLTSVRVTSGTVRVRAQDLERDVVLTIRPGAELRAEALLLPVRGPGPRIAAGAPEELAPGTLVDRYRVEARIGRGGMGAVYRVEHATLGRRHALKVLHAHVLRGERDAIERFLREARAASRIRHPNIVDVFDFGFLPDGRPYFVMELLEGTGLHKVVEGGALELAQAVSIARQLGQALAAAHAAGVIHADVSSPNVIVDRRGSGAVAKLVDFGLAELRDTSAPLAAVADVCSGTPCYIAPEVVRGQQPDERSDQYSFGIVLYELLAGRPPFLARDVEAVCLQHVRDPVPPLASPYGPLPPAIVKLVERALAKSPAQRFASMLALLVELDDASRAALRRGWQRWLRP
jgi:hypothetical protein